MSNTISVLDGPDSIMVIAFDLASSSAVTHLCRSTSEFAFRWNVSEPLLEMTKLHES